MLKNIRFRKCLTIFLFLEIFILSSMEADASNAFDEKVISNFGDYYVAKGGVGVLTEDVAVYATGKYNVLSLPGRKLWRGLGYKKVQTVTIWKGSVIDPQNAPEHFELGESLIVAFYPDKIEFHDFKKNTSGYFRRSQWEPPATGNPYE